MANIWFVVSVYKQVYLTVFFCFLLFCSSKLSRNMPDLTIQGPSGKIITLESVDEVLAYLLKALVPNSVRSSTSSTERKKTEKET